MGFGGPQMTVIEGRRRGGGPGGQKRGKRQGGFPPPPPPPPVGSWPPPVLVAVGGYVVLTVPESVHVTGGQVVVLRIDTEEVLRRSSPLQESVVQRDEALAMMVEGSHWLTVSGGNVSIVWIVPLRVTVIRG